MPGAVAYRRMRVRDSLSKAGYHGDVRGHPEERVSRDRHGGFQLHHGQVSGDRAAVYGDRAVVCRSSGAVNQPVIRLALARSYKAKELAWLMLTGTPGSTAWLIPGSWT